MTFQLEYDDATFCAICDTSFNSIGAGEDHIQTFHTELTVSVIVPERLIQNSEWSLIMAESVLT